MPLVGVRLPQRMGRMTLMFRFCWARGDRKAEDEVLSSSGSLTGVAVASHTVSILFVTWIQPCVGKEGREPLFSLSLPHGWWHFSQNSRKTKVTTLLLYRKPLAVSGCSRCPRPRDHTAGHSGGSASPCRGCSRQGAARAERPGQVTLFPRIKPPPGGPWQDTGSQDRWKGCLLYWNPVSTFPLQASIMQNELYYHVADKNKLCMAGASKSFLSGWSCVTSEFSFSETPVAASC